MAAQVEVTTGLLGQDGDVRAGLVIADQTPGSVSNLPSDVDKPMVGPKPRLTPKPFSLTRNVTIRPITAPKTSKSRQLTPTSSAGESGPECSPKPPSVSPKPDLITLSKPKADVSPKSEPADDVKSTDPSKDDSDGAATGGGKTMPTNVAKDDSKNLSKPVPAPKPGLTRDENGNDPPAEKPTGPNVVPPRSAPKPAEKDKEKMLSRARAKSMGAMDKKRPLLTPYSGDVESPAAPESSKARSTPRCLARNRLPTALTSRFESSPSSSPQKSFRDVSPGRGPRTPPNDAEGKGLLKPSVPLKTSREAGVEKAEDEEMSGGSIKRRISLLLDYSTASKRREAIPRRVESADVAVDIKQRIKELSLDTPPQARTRPPPINVSKQPLLEKQEESPTSPTLGEKSTETPRKRTSSEEVPAERDVEEDAREEMEEEEEEGASDGDGVSTVDPPRYRRVGTLVSATGDGGTERDADKDSEREEEVKQEKGDETQREIKKREEEEEEEREAKIRSERERQLEEERRGQREEMERQKEQEEKRQQEIEEERERERKRVEREKQLEEKRRQIEEEVERERQREEERLRLEKERLDKERKLEEERERQIEEEKQREERERLENERKQEELRKRQEEEKERERQREEERKRQIDAEQQREEQLRLEKERERERQLEEEQRRQIEEDRLRKERERQAEEERLRKERERQIEEERKEREREAEEERLRKERERQIEEDRLKQEKEKQMEEERLRKERERQIEEEKMKREREQQIEEERLRKERERQIEEDRLQQEKERQIEEERLRRERERQIEEERLRKERERQIEEERLRKEREKQIEAERMEREKERQIEEERLREERERQIEQERMRKERERQEEEQRLKVEREKEIEDKRRKQMEEERLRAEERQREEERKKQVEEDRLRQEREREMKEEQERQEEEGRKRQIQEERIQSEREEARQREEKLKSWRSDKTEEEEFEEPKKPEVKVPTTFDLISLDTDDSVNDLAPASPKPTIQDVGPSSTNLTRPAELLYDDFSVGRKTKPSFTNLHNAGGVVFDDFSVKQNEDPSSPLGLTDVVYDDFSARPRKWGTRSRRSPSPTPNPEYPRDALLDQSASVGVSLTDIRTQLLDSQDGHPEITTTTKSPEPEPRRQMFPVTDPEWIPTAQKPSEETEESSVQEQTEDLSEPEETEEPSTEMETNTVPAPESAAALDEGLLNGSEAAEEDRVGGRDTDALIGEPDRHYGTWDRHTPKSPTSQSVEGEPSQDTPFETDSPDHALEEPEPLAFPESTTPLLDSSALRSRAELGKRLSTKRTRPSRSVRHVTALPCVEEGSSPDWRFCDSSEGKAVADDEGSDSEDEQPKDEEHRPTPPQPQRVALFPGMDPSVLKAQLLRKRGGGGDADEEQTVSSSPPVPPVRPQRSPLLSRGPRVLPPLGAKDGGGGPSPSWLLELKSKKRLSQHDSEA